MKSFFNPKDKTLQDIFLKLETRNDIRIVRPSGIWDPKISQTLTQTPLKKLFGKPVKNQNAAKAVIGGLLLWNDDLKACHEIVQTVPDARGSYWHGVMHRRDGDFWNANYWFNAAGPLPAFADIATELRTIFAEVLDQEEWSPQKFTDMVERLDDHDQDYSKFQQILTVELESILRFCYQSVYTA